MPKPRFTVEEYRDGKAAIWQVWEDDLLVHETDDIIDITQFVMSLPYDFEMVKKW